MGHGHNDFGERYKIPDYRIYKVDNHPELVQLRRALASLGLKDPWLRNECWRFNREEFGTPTSNFKTIAFRGFKLGFGAFLVTIALETAYDKFFNKDKHGHEHH